MDPITVILAGLAAGATAGAASGVTDAVKSAVLDAYGGLKSLIVRAFKGNEKAAAALEMYEEDPTEQVLVQKLARHLDEYGLGNDESILSAAQHVLEAAGSASFASSVIAQVRTVHAETGGVAAISIGQAIAGYRGGTSGGDDPH